MSIRTLGPSENARPPRVLQLAVAGSVILMIAAGGLFYYASQVAAKSARPMPALKPWSIFTPATVSRMC